DLGAHLNGARWVVVGRYGVDGYAVPHGELHTAPVDEPEVVALDVVHRHVVARPAQEHGRPVRSARAPHAQLRLKEPRAVTIRLGLTLVVHEEQRHEALALGVRAHGALDADFVLLRVRGDRLDGTLRERDGHTTTAWLAAPGLHFGLLDLTGFGVLSCPRAP